jgi:acetyl/propionyl-CoA carboxylase alpha subunit
MSAAKPAVTSSSAGISIEIDGKLRRLDLTRNPGDNSWTAILDGEPIGVDVCRVQPGILSLIVSGRTFRCVLDEGPLETAIQIGGQRYLFSIEDPRSLTSRRRKAGASAGQQVIKAPMPGRIVRVLVAPGEQVAAHQGVVVIEAMKMQNELKAARAGTIAEIKTEAGATVAAGEVLLLIE